MAIKFEKITAGMMLYDRHRYRMGNTTMTNIGEWDVEVVSIDPDTCTARVRWNGNREQVYHKHQLERLSTWSMHGKDVVVKRSSMFGAVLKVRKMTKAEKLAAGIK